MPSTMRVESNTGSMLRGRGNRCADPATVRSMALKTGDVVPNFELSDEDGTPRKLSDELAKGPVVLFFYPRALTGGCTKESCHFRDLAGEFAAVGANRIG